MLAPLGASTVIACIALFVFPGFGVVWLFATICFVATGTVVGFIMLGSSRRAIESARSPRARLLLTSVLAWLIAAVLAPLVLLGLNAAIWALWQLLSSSNLPLADMGWSTYFGSLALTGLPFVTAVIASAAFLPLSVAVSDQIPSAQR